MQGLGWKESRRRQGSGTLPHNALPSTASLPWARDDLLPLGRSLATGLTGEMGSLENQRRLTDGQQLGGGGLKATDSYTAEQTRNGSSYISHTYTKWTL